MLVASFPSRPTSNSGFWKIPSLGFVGTKMREYRGWIVQHYCFGWSSVLLGPKHKELGLLAIEPMAPSVCPHFNIYNCKHTVCVYIRRLWFSLLLLFLHVFFGVHRQKTCPSCSETHNRGQNMFYYLFLAARYESLPPPLSHTRCWPNKSHRGALETAAARSVLLHCVKTRIGIGCLFCLYTQKVYILALCI